MQQPNSAIISKLANSEHWPGDSGDLDDPSIVKWLATSQTTPYAGDDIAARNIAAAAKKVGPAVLFGHSAGVSSTILAALKAPDAVSGLLIFEGDVNLLSEANRAAATWDPPLPQDFKPVDKNGCPMQPEGDASRNVSLENTPVTIIRTEHGIGSDAMFECAVRQLKQMGVEAKFVQLADNGFPGGGHFMMSDTNAGAVAEDILLPIIGDFMDKEPLPKSWTVVD